MNLHCFGNVYFRGSGVIYVINEVDGILEIAHRLQVSTKNFPGKIPHFNTVFCLQFVDRITQQTLQTQIRLCQRTYLGLQCFVCRLILSAETGCVFAYSAFESRKSRVSLTNILVSLGKPGHSMCCSCRQRCVESQQ